MCQHHSVTRKKSKQKKEYRSILEITSGYYLTGVLIPKILKQPNITYRGPAALVAVGSGCWFYVLPSSNFPLGVNC